MHWSTVLKNHANAIVACDFFTVVTVCFRVVYVFVALEIGSRRLIHFNATEHPTAEWTLQQLRETLPGGREYKFLGPDRHKAFSVGLDEEVASWGIEVVKITRTCAHGKRLFRTINRKHTSRVFGLCDTAE